MLPPFSGHGGGIALSHLPGLPLVAGVAMGIGAMAVVMLSLPLASVLLATLLLASDGLAVMPLVIVAVVVAQPAKRGAHAWDRWHRHAYMVRRAPSRLWPRANSLGFQGGPLPHHRSQDRRRHIGPRRQVSRLALRQS